MYPSRGVYLRNDVICDGKERGGMNLVTPDATRRVRSTFPPVSPPPPPPSCSFYSTDHPSAAPIYRPPFVSSMTRRGRRNVTKVRGSKPLIVACPSFFFFPTMNSLLFVSFKILYRFGGDYIGRVFYCCHTLDLDASLWNSWIHSRGKLRLRGKFSANYWKRNQKL